MKFVKLWSDGEKIRTAGYASLFVLEESSKGVRLFHPATCDSIKLSAKEYSAMKPQEADYDKKKMGEWTLIGYRNAKAYGRMHNRSDVEEVCKHLGVDPDARPEPEPGSVAALFNTAPDEPVTKPEATAKPARPKSEGMAKPKRAAAVIDEYAEMSADDLAKEVKKRKIKVSLEAPNKGVLVMRLRNALRNYDKENKK